MNTYNTLREANVARQKEYRDTRTDSDVVAPVSPSFRGNEMAGEVGEVLAAVAAHEEPIAILSELADVVITADLTLMECCRPPIDSPAAFPTLLNLKTMCLTLAQCSGMACNQVKKMDRSLQGFVGSKYDPASLDLYLGATIHSACAMAHVLGYDIDAAVQTKFNADSEKLGFRTRLNYRPTEAPTGFHGAEDMGPEARQDRADTFDILDACVSDINSSGRADTANRLSAAYARGTGGIDIDIVVDVLTDMLTELQEDIDERDKHLEQAHRIILLGALAVSELTGEDMPESLAEMVAAEYGLDGLDGLVDSLKPSAKQRDDYSAVFKDMSDRLRRG